MVSNVKQSYFISESDINASLALCVTVSRDIALQLLRARGKWTPRLLRWAATQAQVLADLDSQKVDDVVKHMTANKKWCAMTATSELEVVSVKPREVTTMPAITVATTLFPALPSPCRI